MTTGHRTDGAAADLGYAGRTTALWASGDYAKTVTELLCPLGRALVRASAIRPGDRVLDVAAGTGNVAIPAALTGADVIASDLCPELLDRGRELAQTRGARLHWQVANAEALPFDTNKFDAVLSCVGMMFAPQHQCAADELVRVCKPGGIIGLINWTSDGFMSELMTTIKPYLDAPQPGSQPAARWGDAAYVRDLLGDRVSNFTAEQHTLRVVMFADGEAFRDYMKAHCPPPRAAYQRIANDPRRVDELDDKLAALAERYLAGTPSTMEWDYLLVTARKRQSPECVSPAMPSAVSHNSIRSDQFRDDKQCTRDDARRV
ncbi:SAM-dependent methyltransferase [Mycobacterium kansasii]|uniref:Ubiquinone/menaquinone biosynthesis C-methyltransferase UbiE n=1 Tax=Mycobacterium attenuatum TaxID=2341086 RepID=A0A498QEQ8_9MYCO|nr:SAM-dependent methyltransferase [Mycobacterium kansasii]VBA44076.1 Ubiquinone/menaquinone biosynthesis C-methyltransferase UbiE [Mycobacterium attenuatum]